LSIYFCKAPGSLAASASGQNSSRAATSISDFVLNVKLCDLAKSRTPFHLSFAVSSDKRFSSPVCVMNERMNADPWSIDARTGVSGPRQMQIVFVCLTWHARRGTGTNMLTHQSIRTGLQGGLALFVLGFYHFRVEFGEQPQHAAHTATRAWSSCVRARVRVRLCASTWTKPECIKTRIDKYRSI